MSAEPVGWTGRRGCERASSPRREAAETMLFSLPAETPRGENREQPDSCPRRLDTPTLLDPLPRAESCWGRGRLFLPGYLALTTNKDCLITGRLAKVATCHVQRSNIRGDLGQDSNKATHNNLAAAHGVDFSLGQLDRQRNLRVWRHKLCPSLWAPNAGLWWGLRPVARRHHGAAPRGCHDATRRGTDLGSSTRVAWSKAEFCIARAAPSSCRLDRNWLWLGCDRAGEPELTSTSANFAKKPVKSVG
jgi:hypothetical protein